MLSFYLMVLEKVEYFGIYAREKLIKFIVKMCWKFLSERAHVYTVTPGCV